MSLSLLHRLAFVLIVWIGVGLFTVVDRGPERPPAKLDCETRSIDVFGSDQPLHTLHVALVHTGPDAEAILDAVSIPLRKRADFELKLGFATVEPESQPNSSSLRFGHNGSDFGSMTRRRAVMPRGFGHFSRSMRLGARYHGFSDGMHLIGIESMKLSYTKNTPNGTTSASFGRPSGPLALKTGRPVIRQHAKLSLFWCAIVLRSGTTFEAGRRETWREAFRSLPITDPLPDRRSLYRASTALKPEGMGHVLNSEHIVTFGPLVERWTGAFALGDEESYATCLDALSDPPERVESIRRLAMPYTGDLTPSWHEQSGARPWMDFLASCVSGVPRPLGFGTERNEQWLRLLRLDPRPVVIDLAAAEIGKQSLDPTLRAHLIESPLQTEDPVRKTATSRVRDHAISGLPTPWNMLLRGRWQLWLVIGSIPALALLLVTTKRNPGQKRLQLQGRALFAFAIGCFLTIDSASFAWLTIPLSIWFTRRWLREDISHGIGERFFLALTISALWIWSLQKSEFFPAQPHLDFVAGHGVIAAWILIGRAIVRDGRWRRTQLFVVALSLLLGGVVFVEATGDQGTVGKITLVTSALAFFAFLISGTRSGERPKLEWSTA